MSHHSHNAYPSLPKFGGCDRFTVYHYNGKESSGIIIETLAIMLSPPPLLSDMPKDRRDQTPLISHFRPVAAVRPQTLSVLSSPPIHPKIHLHLSPPASQAVTTSSGKQYLTPSSYSITDLAYHSIVGGSRLRSSSPAIESLAFRLFSFFPLEFHTFYPPDLGCSVGPNTFIAVHNIIAAVEHKYRSEGLDSSIPEFQVLFSDQTSNDFNTLFTTLPLDRRYFVAGVPGSFHSRLFPEASLHFVYSAYALHFLSKLSKEVVEKRSPA
ncbi:hypothetical protein HHK36_014785 [Tetracentron sinense]|uniref:Uncharacterized protein n=1 Tax=Tetracentron sinense TaxID=13715 RepID=A0A834Z3H9_TETSI|nr:hypothetical protein HHK36_014785 [Tetracentron sinense]